MRRCGICSSGRKTKWSLRPPSRAPSPSPSHAPSPSPSPARGRGLG
ncbi:hypothetical protein [Lysobacter gummosus]